MHADHVTGTGYLRVLSGCRTIISKSSGAQADIWVEENDEIVFGNQKLTVFSTPGHTNGCVTYYNKQQVSKFPIFNDGVNVCIIRDWHSLAMLF